MTNRSTASIDRFRVSPHALFERIHDEGVILDSRGEIYFGLNAAGTRIWEVIAGGATIEDAAQRLVEHYGITPEQARTDTAALVDELVGRQLITPEPRR